MTVRVLLIEPYYTGSHQTWADGLKAHSSHDIQLLTLPGQFWKWRMQGGAVTAARMFADYDDPDVIIASDMINAATFRALTRHRTANTPLAMYFHENQLTYPQSNRQNHGWQYGVVNYLSAMASEALYFNSTFHLESFFATLPHMLKHFGDLNELDTIPVLREKARTLSPGVDLRQLDAYHSAQRERSSVPLLLWNHRWEFDKRPDRFLNGLKVLVKAGVPFELAILGENPAQTATEFEDAHRWLGDRIVQYGYVDSDADYARWLWRADYVISTADHDFFGIAVTEAMYCGCIPILPFRLNYPALVPESLHEVCLYRTGQFANKLKAHLKGQHDVDRDELRSHVAAFDWATMAPLYDREIERLAAYSASGSGASTLLT